MTHLLELFRSEYYQGAVIGRFLLAVIIPVAQGPVLLTRFALVQPQLTKKDQSEH